jgi:hypothetical protein
MSTIQDSQEQQGFHAYLPLIGIVLLLIATFVGYRAFTYTPDVIWCGEDRMTPGDVCLAYGRGGGTFDEMRAAQERSHTIDVYVVIGAASLGVLSILLPLLLQISKRRQRLMG